MLARASARSPLAEALRYAVKLKPQLLAYTGDGRLEIDNNLAENALRGIAVGRKNWLFAGADCGGERAAAIYSLLETAIRVQGLATLGDLSRLPELSA